MSDIVRLRTAAEIEDEAAAWVWRLDSESISSSDRQSFGAWIRRDPRHRRAFEELGGVWRALDGLADAKRAEKIATFAQMPASPQPRAFGLRRSLLAVAAALAAICIATLFLHQRGNEAQTIATAVGQQRALTLADGSVVQLNTNSTLETRFVSVLREVYLGKGEAHFKVAHDAQRPFRVYAGGAIIRAVGTEFDVRVHDDRSVEVIVTEGRVEVLADERDPSPNTLQPASREKIMNRRQLAAGQRFLARNGAATVAPIGVAEVSRVLAWRKGAVVFDGDTLARAVAELNRYTEARFIVADPAVGELRVGGRFKTDDVEGIVRGLESALPISVRRTDDGLILIEPRR